MVLRQYRINRDRIITCRWAVQVKRLWWPFWTDEVDMLPSRDEAEELLELLNASNGRGAV